MYPTLHDITPSNLNLSVRLLRRMAKAHENNRILITTKPRLECIETIIHRLDYWKDQFQFRFTIGSNLSKVLEKYEPGAPSFDERFHCLVNAFNAGWKTSVSCEPYLSDPVPTYLALAPWVSESIWFGPMNHPEIVNRFPELRHLYFPARMKLWEMELDRFPLARFKYHWRLKTGRESFRSVAAQMLGCNYDR